MNRIMVEILEYVLTFLLEVKNIQDGNIHFFLMVF